MMQKRFWWMAPALALAVVGGIAGHAAFDEAPVGADIGEVDHGAAPTRSELAVADLEPITTPKIAAVELSQSLPTPAQLAEIEAIPPDMPVHDMLATYGERARAGDAALACRLAYALMQCRMHRMARGRAAEPPDVSDPKQLDAYVDFEARRQEVLGAIGERCRGLEPSDYQQAFELTARAALAGHSGSIASFLQMPMTDLGSFIADPTRPALYRAQAWPLAERAMRAGYRDIAMQVFHQVAQSDAFEGPILAVLPARYRDAGAARALLQQFDQPERLFGTGDPPAPRSEQERTAQKWIDELFDGRIPSRAAGAFGMVSLTRDRSTGCADPDAYVAVDSRP